jgi:Alpha/beta hydrolase domain
VATYTGWALRRAPFAEGEDCALTGQYIPFEKTRDERLNKGDPRLSLEERYKSHDQYVTLVERAADRLVRQRLLLDEDAVTIKTGAAESEVGK